MLFRSRFSTKWQADWEKRADCRQTKLWFPYISKRLSFSLLALGRIELSKMIQLITGHNFLKRHEALVNKSEDADCRLCLEDEETSFHVIAECPALARQRQQTFGKCFLAPFGIGPHGGLPASFVRHRLASSWIRPTMKGLQSRLKFVQT